MRLPSAKRQSFRLRLPFNRKTRETNSTSKIAKATVDSKLISISDAARQVTVAATRRIENKPSTPFASRIPVSSDNPHEEKESAAHS